MINILFKALAYPVAILTLSVAPFISISTETFPSQEQRAQIIPLPDVLEAVDIAVAKGKIIIAETTHIASYSLEDFHLEKIFGRRGEGPGEFTHPPHITALDDRLVANTMGKLIHYSYSGDIIEETKIIIPYNYGTWPMLPVGENYVGFPMEVQKTEKGTLRLFHYGRLYDQEFRPMKQLCEPIRPLAPPPPPPPRKGTKPKPTPRQDFQAIPEYVDYAITDNKIYLADNRKGFHIFVFDKQATLLREIKKDYNPLKVPDEYKDTYMKRQREHPEWESRHRQFNYLFRKYFPAFSSFKVADEKIYATTYENKEGKYEIVVMDLTGKEMKRSYSFPHPPYQDPSYSLSLFSNTYEIFQDKIYTLAYNYETDVYELHIHPIK
jgi:hypothetical protein